MGTIRYRGVCEYIGGAFCGWQRQPVGVSVQGTLEAAAQLFHDRVLASRGRTSEPVRVVGAGRTDAGVHALAMPFHVDLTANERSGSDGVYPTLRQAIQSGIPPNVPLRIISLEPTWPDFHARFHCTRRHYLYRIRHSCPLSTMQSVFTQTRTDRWFIHDKLDIAAIQESCLMLEGTHDFTSFTTAKAHTSSNMRRLLSATCTVDGPNISLSFTADAFLHRQVRNMVAALVLAGLHAPPSVPWLLEEPSLRSLRSSAPAHGLYFAAAEYHDEQRVV